MTKYEWFNNGHARIGFQFGEVSTHAMIKFIRYKEYLSFLRDGHNSGTAVELTAEKMKCDRSTIYRAIVEFKDSTNII